MITAIIFDFGNVVCTFDITIFLHRIAASTGRPLAEVEGLLPALSAEAIRYETGLSGSDEFFRSISSLCGLSVPREEFIRAYCDIFSPIPTTIELIRQLKPNYRLGLLSNTSEWHFRYSIKPVEVFPLFDTVTLSFEVKAMKPARAIYFDALAKLKMAPEECVYIDDIRENAEAATALGMHGIHYTSHDQLVSTLRDLAVAVD